MAYKKQGKMPDNYMSIFEAGKLEGIPITKLKKAVSDHRVNAAKFLNELKPISHLFREFKKGSRKTYAICQSHYYWWKKTGEAPKTSPGRPKKIEKDTPWIRYKDAPEFYGSKNLKIPTPPFYEEFKRGAYKKGLTVKLALFCAMKEYMDRRPSVFKDITFVAGVEKANKMSIQKVSIRDCLHQAMKEYMDRHPEIFLEEELI